MSIVAFVSTRPALRDRVLIGPQVIGTGFTFISLFSMITTGLVGTSLTPAEMRWGLGLPMADIDLPAEQIVRHYFVDLWADMCK